MRWLFLAVIFFSCGGGGKPQQADQQAQLNPPSLQGGPQTTTSQATPKAIEVDPKVAILRPFFARYAMRPLEGKINIFKSNLASFAPHVEVDLSAESETSGPKTPLEYYDVDSYKLVLIMSGIPQPKALVLDPKEKSYVLTEGTKIGNRGGKVVAITETEVRIEEPGHPPIIKALEQPWSEMEKALQAVQEF